MLDRLEVQLQQAGKFWAYESRITPDMTEDEKVEIANMVLNATDSWAKKFGQEFQSRSCPEGYDEDQS